MKKHILLTAAALSALMIGCRESDLDIVQKGVDLTETPDTYYKTEAGAQAAIAKVYVDTQKNFAMIGDINGYNYGPYMALTNFLSDDIYMAGTGSGDCVDEREYHDFRFGPDNIVPYGGYTAFYRSIHKCNLVINNVPKDGTAIQKKAIAEARVMRAFDYMNLAIYWGNPPMVLEVLTGASQPANDQEKSPKDAQADVLKWCVEEIDAALPDLDERKDVNDAAGAYKITKGFANAIKGKCLLWKGDNAGAKTALAAVINSGKYSLLPGNEMYKIMHSDGKGTSESVFEFNYVYLPGITDGTAGQVRVCWNSSNTFSWRNEWFKSLSQNRVYNGGWHWINPTGAFAKTLVENDGMDSYRRKAWIVSFDEVLQDAELNDGMKGRTTTFKKAKAGTEGKAESDVEEIQVPESFWVYENIPELGWDENHVAIKNADKKVLYTGKYQLRKGFAKDQVFPCCEGWLPYKFIIHTNQGDMSPEINPQTRNYPIMRYAEVLLLYAEACVGNDGDGSGLKALNDIQNRAHGGKGYVSKSLTLADVKKEKQLEMWMEGCRYADLVRWGDYDGVKKADHYTPGYDPNKGKVVDDYFDGADYYVKTYGKGNLGFKEGKNEFLPFPEKVMQSNTALKQNPGW